MRYKDIHRKPVKKNNPNRKLTPLEQMVFLKDAYPSITKNEIKDIMRRGNNDYGDNLQDDDYLELLCVQAGIKDNTVQ